MYMENLTTKMSFEHNLWVSPLSFLWVVVVSISIQFSFSILYALSHFQKIYVCIKCNAQNSDFLSLTTLASDWCIEHLKKDMFNIFVFFHFSSLLSFSKNYIFFVFYIVCILYMCNATLSQKVLWLFLSLFLLMDFYASFMLG